MLILDYVPKKKLKNRENDLNGEIPVLVIFCATQVNTEPSINLLRRVTKKPTEFYPSRKLYMKIINQKQIDSNYFSLI